MPREDAEEQNVEQGFDAKTSERNDAIHSFEDGRVVVETTLVKRSFPLFLSSRLVFVGDQSRVRIREKGADKLEKRERED